MKLREHLEIAFLPEREIGEWTVKGVRRARCYLFHWRKQKLNFRNHPIPGWRCLICGEVWGGKVPEEEP